MPAATTTIATSIRMIGFISDQSDVFLVLLPGEVPAELPDVSFDAIEPLPAFLERHEKSHQLDDASVSGLLRLHCLGWTHESSVPFVDPSLLHHGPEVVTGDVVESAFSPPDLHLDPSTLGLDVVTERGSQDKHGEHCKHSDRDDGDDEKPEHYFSRLTVSLTTWAMSSAARSPSARRRGAADGTSSDS